MLICRLNQARKVLLLSAACAAGFIFQNNSNAAQSLKLSWNPSKDPSVSGYNVYYGKSSGVFDHKVSVGNATTVTVSGLVEGTTYYFVATASTTSGLESPPSGQISYTVPGTWLSITPMLVSGVRAVKIASSGVIRSPWTLQTSPDLKTWSTMSKGTNSLVQVTNSSTSVPAAFYRVTSP